MHNTIVELPLDWEIKRIGIDVLSAESRDRQNVLIVACDSFARQHGYDLSYFRGPAFLECLAFQIGAGLLLERGEGARVLSQFPVWAEDAAAWRHGGGEHGFMTDMR